MLVYLVLSRRWWCSPRTSCIQLILVFCNIFTQSFKFNYLITLSQRKMLSFMSSSMECHTKVTPKNNFLCLFPPYDQIHNHRISRRTSSVQFPLYLLQSSFLIFFFYFISAQTEMKEVCALIMYIRAAIDYNMLIEWISKLVSIKPMCTKTFE